MSNFWPFGQPWNNGNNTNINNINRLLDEYHQLVNDLEIQGKLQGLMLKNSNKKYKENHNDENDNNINEISNEISNSSSDSLIISKEKDNIASQGVTNETNTVINNNREIIDNTNNNNNRDNVADNGNISNDNSNNNNNSNNAFNENNDTTTTTNDNNDNDNNDTNDTNDISTIEITHIDSIVNLQQLDHSFIDNVLNEPELLNELNRQNNLLLDFICLGFFYDETSKTMINNIDYLLTELLVSIKNISADQNNDSGITNNRNNKSANDDPSLDGDNITDSKEKDSTHASVDLTANSLQDDEIINSSKINPNDNNYSNSDLKLSDLEPNSISNSNDNNATYENDDITTNNSNTISPSVSSSISSLIEEPPYPKYLNRATIISEIFSLNIWLITDSVVKNSQYLAKVWSILNFININNNKNNSPLISIFLKINQNLLFTNQEFYLNFIKLNLNFTNILLKFIKISPLIDFFIKCISTDKVETPTGIIDLLYNQNFIPKCLKFFDNKKFSADIQNSIGDLLKALITISSNTPLDDMSIGPNILTRQMVLPNTIDKFINIILYYKGNSLNVIISIVIELIRKNNSDYDQINLLNTTIKSYPPTNRDPIYLGFLLKKFSLILPELTSLIRNDNIDSVTKSTIILKNQLNEDYKPLGFEKFKIIELIAELLHCSNMGLMNSKKVEKIIKVRHIIRKKILKQIRLDYNKVHCTNTDDLLLAINNLSLDDIRDGDGMIKSTSKLNITTFDEGLQQMVSNTSRDEYTCASDVDNTKLNSLNDNESSNDINDNMTPNTNDDGSAQNFSLDDDGISGISDLDEEQLKNIENIDEDLIKDDDIDESFEIPYINDNQNSKLRKNSTIGDLFKISLYDSRFIIISIKSFLTNPWNNFWHNVIFDIIHQIFNGRMDFTYNSFLVYSLFDLNGSFKFIPNVNENSNSVKSEVPNNTLSEECNFSIINDFILKGYKDSYQFFKKTNMNLGYMGHLVLIAEEVVKFSKLYKVELISPTINDILQEEIWQSYTDNILNETRIMYSKILGGGTFIDDGNGNIIPQMVDPNTDSSQPDDDGNNNILGNNLNDQTQEKELSFSTELNLHKMIGNKLLHETQL